MYQKPPQAGFTLTELMISVTLSMSVIGSMLMSYVATHVSSAQQLSSARLNQDLSAIINLMSSELQRAGYRSKPANSDPNYLLAGDKSNIATLKLYALRDSSTPLPATSSGTCILYAYDRNGDGSLAEDEAAGFRFSAGAVQMKITGQHSEQSGCSSAEDSWSSISDPDFITITNLTFSMAQSVCVNYREPDGIDNDKNGVTDNVEEKDCYRIPQHDLTAGDIITEARHVTIRLAGHQRNDAFVEQTLTRDVHIRNDLVRTL